MVPTTERTAQPASTTSTYHRPLSATALVGDKIKNREGETLGTLKEIILDVQSGRIAYGVLESSSFLQMNHKFLAIPFRAFTINESDHALVLDVNKETIRNAEGFDKNNWPDFASQEWAQRTHSYYGYEPYFNQRQEELGL